MSSISRFTQKQLSNRKQAVTQSNPLSLVTVPPRLHMDPTESDVVVRADTTVALKCKASGNPPPKLVWRKRNDRLPASALVTDNGRTLSMSRVGRHHSGVYECEAANGVGAAVTAQINLNVLCEFFLCILRWYASLVNMGGLVCSVCGVQGFGGTD